MRCTSSGRLLLRRVHLDQRLDDGKQQGHADEDDDHDAAHLGFLSWLVRSPLVDALRNEEQKGNGDEGGDGAPTACQSW